MPKVALFLADGFEEIEALSVIDILRRADVSVKSVSISNSNDNQVCGAHGIKVIADAKFSDLNEQYDMLICPGGLPGATNLASFEPLLELLRSHDRTGKFIAAICAAPSVLAAANVLKKAFTCYPGWQENINHTAIYQPSPNVIKDENIITSRGPATAMEFALFLVGILKGDDVKNRLKKELLFA